jgi:hypothetical protein
MNYIAFQEYIPIEQQSGNRCIWCGNVSKKNRAHIIAKKLTTQAIQAPVLRATVCQNCNSVCGKLEAWILRKTPLSWIRFMSYLDSSKTSKSSNSLSYCYSESFREWIVFYLGTYGYVIPPQLLLRKSSATLISGSETFSEVEEERKLLFELLQKRQYDFDVRASLPLDFTARLVRYTSHTTAVCRCQAEFEDCIGTPNVSKYEDLGGEKRRLENTGNERIHFMWSRAKWAQFCAKSAYEALCLFEGAAVCLQPAYQETRKFVLKQNETSGREILFSKHGPLSKNDVPQPVGLDLTLGQNAPGIAALVSGVDPLMHSILLYEIDGWVAATVSFAGFPPSVLILAGPNAHLNDLYHLIYDNKEHSYHFLRLAFDQTRPIIQLPFGGHSIDQLAKTYRLNCIKT